MFRSLLRPLVPWLVFVAAFVGPTAVRRSFADPPPAPSGKHWELSWNDEFDGSAVDTTKWDFWHDGEMRRAALNLAENTYLGGGNLTVRITHTNGQLTAGGLQ